MHILTGLFPNQILQRDRRGFATITATGRTIATGSVMVIVKGLRGFAKPRRAGLARGGRFSVKLSRLPVGGPYRIELRCGGESTVVDGVRVGDVWLLAGQSNMQGYGDIATGLRRAPDVFALTMSGVWMPAEEPVHLLEESSDPAHTAETITPEQAAVARRDALLGAGPGIPFAAEMVRRTGVPQGLIACAHGGSSLTQWDAALKKQGGRSLYGSMFKTWQSTGQPVAGMLWYQGESDANETACELYTKRFVRFVRALRRDLKQTRLPVLTVQLSRIMGAGEGSIRPWNRIQEQQRLMPNLLDRCGVVPAVDLPLSDNIHLSGAAQRRLGLRLARLASRLVHQDRSEPAPPAIARVKRLRLPNQNGIFYEVKFSNVVGGLHGQVEQAFSLVDADHRIVDAIIRTEWIGGDRLRIIAWPNLAKPGARLMYGHGCNPPALLADDRDFAVPVTGPLRIEGEMVAGPGMNAWQGGITVHPEILAKLDAASTARLAAQDDYITSGEPHWPEFINHHPRWVGKRGVACFVTEFESAAAQFVLGFGYDGPVRLWLDGKEIHSNPKGTNPCIADHHLIPIRLKPGRHRLALALDVNGGQAWGFTLRWLAPDDGAVPGTHHWPTPVNPT
jgi:sialate O-acetylesterase